MIKDELFVFQMLVLRDELFVFRMLALKKIFAGSLMISCLGERAVIENCFAM